MDSEVCKRSQRKTAPPIETLELCVRLLTDIILAVELKLINQDCMIFADFSVNFEPISLKFCKGHLFYSNPHSGKNFAKLY